VNIASASASVTVVFSVSAVDIVSAAGSQAPGNQATAAGELFHHQLCL